MQIHKYKYTNTQMHYGTTALLPVTAYVLSSCDNRQPADPLLQISDFSICEGKLHFADINVLTSSQPSHPAPATTTMWYQASFLHWVPLWVYIFRGTMHLKDAVPHVCIWWYLVFQCPEIYSRQGFFPPTPPSSLRTENTLAQQQRRGARPL